MTELKPCPFCGEKAYIKEYANGHKNKGNTREFVANYEVGCKSCGIHFNYESRFVLENGQPKFSQNGYDKCVEVWNRRVNEDVA